MFTPVTNPSDSNRLKEGLLKLMYPSGRFPRSSQDALPGPLPATMSRANLNLLKEHRYWVAEKSDGTRNMLMVYGKSVYLVDRTYLFVKLKADHLTNITVSGTFSLLDGELVESLKDKRPCFLAYDALVINGERVENFSYEKRLDAVRKFIVDPLRNVQSGEHFEDLPIDMKRIVPCSEIEDIITRIRKPGIRKDGSKEKYFSYHDEELQRFNKNDGLVFTRNDDSFFTQHPYTLLKWKWPELNTIDFKIKRPWFNRRAEEELMLYAGSYGNQDICVRRTTIAPHVKQWIEDTIIKRGLEEVVVECGYEPGTSSWKIHKWRPDKSKANFITTVISTLETIIDNVSIEELVNVCQKNR